MTIRINSRVSDEMTKALKDSQMIHSSEKSLAKSRPCLEIADKNVTFLKAVSKKSRRLVSVSPLQTYDVAFCASEDEQKGPKCAPESRCTTVYSKFFDLWKKVIVKTGF